MHRPDTLAWMDTLGKRVRAAREALHWSQQKLAERVVRAGAPSMSQVGIQKIESGTTKRPACVPELAVALGLSVDYLKTGRGNRTAARRNDDAVPVRSYVGAGDEIVIVPEDESPIDWVPAPPGLENCEATEVRGRSMMPLYHDGDLLYHLRRADIDLGEFADQVVVAQVVGGKRWVKVLKPGSRRGRYTLESINPAFDAIEDQQLEWIGPIEWVHKRWRKARFKPRKR